MRLWVTSHYGSIHHTTTLDRSLENIINVGIRTMDTAVLSVYTVLGAHH